MSQASSQTTSALAGALPLLLDALRAGHPHATESTLAARALAAPEVSVAAKTDFLRGLTENLITDTVLAEFARVFRELARDPGVSRWADEAIDVCGTGGDHSGSYNISTTVAFIVAAAGVPVFKHGNRSITSQCGSADFLLALGIPLEAPAEVWHEALDKLHFAFFFAPAFHPAFQYVSLARKVLAAEKRRTVFNLLGPLLNPGRPRHQLVGVFSRAYLAPLAGALEMLGTKRGLVVHGRLPGKNDHDGLDELSVMDDNLIVNVGDLIKSPKGHPDDHSRNILLLKPEDAGLTTAPVSDLKGGDTAHNLTLLDALFDNRAPAGLADTVCLNAGAALWVAGRATNLRAGVTEARRLLSQGPVRDWLGRTQTFFANVKKSAPGA